MQVVDIARGKFLKVSDKINVADDRQETPEDLPLHEMIREAMDRRGMSNNALAKASGVVEGTIRNLLREEGNPDATGPKAHVLKQVAEVLELDDLRVFQAAGYIRKDRLESHLSLRAEFLATRFDKLPADKQELLLGMLTSLEKMSGIASPSETVQDVLDEVRKLRKQYPLFNTRRFVLTDRLGRFLGGAMGKLTNDTIETICEDAVLERLQVLFRRDLSQPISRDILRRVVSHTSATVALNALLPHKNIPSNIEKLYWLIFPENKSLEDLDEDTRNAIEALWRLLVRIGTPQQHEGAE
jgi:transcriptional regulator with XRE-family HTH domain